MTTFTDQITDWITLAQRAAEDHPWEAADIIAAASAVYQAFMDNPRTISRPFGVTHCLRWSDADPHLGEATSYRLAGCSGWNTRLEAAVEDLANTLEAAGETGQAEVGRAIADQVETMTDTTDRQDVDWWENLPAGLKLAAVALGAWIALDVYSKVK